jgi:hypothetical protein
MVVQHWGRGGEHIHRRLTADGHPAVLHSLLIYNHSALKVTESLLTVTGGEL